MRIDNITVKSQLIINRFNKLMLILFYKEEKHKVIQSKIYLEIIICKII